MPTLIDRPMPEMLERLQASTDVVKTGTQEFAKSRRPLRTALEYNLTFYDTRFAAFEEEVRADLRADWIVPFWHERTRFLDLSAGQSVIDCNTDADYRGGGQMMIWKGCSEYELATIDTVVSGSVTLTGGLSASYVRAAVMPAHASYLSNSPRLGRRSRGLMQMTMEFTLINEADLQASVWGTYAGYEVLGCSGAYLKQLSGVIEVATDYVDSQLGLVGRVPARPVEPSQFAVVMSDHAWQAKQFWHRVRGRDGAFWVKSWGGALSLQAAVASGVQIVEVATTRPAPQMIDRHVKIGDQYRQITNAVDGGGTQTLTLDAVLTAGVTPSTPISLLSLVRADTDELAISHRHGSASRLSFPVQEYLQ